MEKQEVLQKCTVSGTIVRLPQIQLDRKLYQEVAKALELIGGKWKGGKIAGFIFEEEPSELLEQIASGEKRNIKKEYQFFATPDNIADELVSMAQIERCHTILEPSAGQGAIIKAIHRTLPNKNVHWCEIMPLNQTFCRRLSDTTFISEDIFVHSISNFYDRIIANPPFSKNQDIDHIRKMYDLLKMGGRLVSIASKHWQFAEGKKELAFKNWLDEVGAEVIEITRGAFKDSGTMVPTCIIIIDKRLK